MPNAISSELRGRETKVAHACLTGIALFLVAVWVFPAVSAGHGADPPVEIPSPSPPDGRSGDVGLSLDLPTVSAPVRVEAPTKINVSFTNEAVRFKLPGQETPPFTEGSASPVGDTQADRGSGLSSSPPSSAIAVGAIVQTAVAVAVATYHSEALWWRDVLRWRGGFSFAPLFSRLRRERLLDHPVRRLIYGEIRDHPGIHYRELLRKLMISNGALAFHLFHLERAGFIRSDRVLGRRHLRVTERLVKPEDFLVAEPPRRIIELVRATPGVSQREIMRALSLKRSTVSYHIKALRSLGIIEIRRAGRSTQCFLYEI